MEILRRNLRPPGSEWRIGRGGRRAFRPEVELIDMREGREARSRRRVNNVRRPDQDPSDGFLLALVGPWLLNKGDVLMMRSVLEHYPKTPIGAPREFWVGGLPANLVVPVSRLPEASELRRSLRRPRTFVHLAAKWASLSMPPALSLRLTGRVGAQRVTGLLDSSGFAYGDPWPPGRALQRAEYYRALRRRGVPIVLLPQAFGPFRKPEVREAARALASCCDMIVARDVDSRAHLEDLDLDERVRLRCSPDITHLLDGTPPPDPEAWARRVCIVPNTRMVDRTTPEHGAAYLDFLMEAVAQIRAADLEPWFVLHEENDAPLLRDLNCRFERPLPILDEDALVTKGIFACCRAVVSSRYHALISALSHATPVIGMSWSHKYERLFEEYEHGDYMLSPEASPELRASRLAALLEDPERARIVERLGRIATRQKTRVSEMWAEADAVIGMPSAAEVRLPA